MNPPPALPKLAQPDHYPVVTDSQLKYALWSAPVSNATVFPFCCTTMESLFITAACKHTQHIKHGSDRQNFRSWDLKSRNPILRRNSRRSTRRASEIGRATCRERV